MFLLNSGQTAVFDKVTGAPNQNTVKIKVQGKEFQGVGRSLKFAKRDAAQKVLLQIFRIKCDTQGIIISIPFQATMPRF